MAAREAEIERQAVGDGKARSNEEAGPAMVDPPPTAEWVRDLRIRFGLSQVEFARRFGFSVHTLQQFEQGRRAPSGPAAVLLRVIDAEPEAVARALERR